MIDELLLLSGNDVPFFPANIVIHQPLIKEIAYIGEENFFIGCQLFSFSKDMLSEEDRINLLDTNNFDILMSIVNDKSAPAQKIHAMIILGLLFPSYTVNFETDGIYLNSEENSTVINRDNYEEFQEIFKQMFGLSKKKDEYNPSNKRAREIAEKLKRGREKAAEAKGLGKKVAVFSRYVSILAIGMKMDVDVFLNYTVYQLYDAFERFQLKQAFDLNIQARMAGATDLDEADNWMEDIHS